MLKPISIFAEQAFPPHIVDENPVFVDFFRSYLEWLQGEEQAYGLISSLRDLTDIDATFDTYLSKFSAEQLADFPSSLAADTRLLVKNIIQFYIAKGTEQSFKFLFSVLYNTFVEFYYPKNDILRVSDGKWIQPYYLYSATLTDVQRQNLVGRTIIGLTSNATAVVDSIIPYTYDFGSGSQQYQVLRLFSTNGNFEVGENAVTLAIEGVNSISFTVNGFVVGEGYWVGTDGFVSSNKKIQDSFYYQDFSYVLRTDVSVSEFKDVIKRLVHPAGMMIFGEFHSKGAETTMYSIPVVPMFTFLVSWITAFSEPAQLTDIIHYQRKVTPTIALGPTYDMAEVDKMQYWGSVGVYDAFGGTVVDEILTKENAKSTWVFNSSGLLVEPNTIDWVNMLYPTQSTIDVVSLNITRGTEQTTLSSGIAKVNEDLPTASLCVFASGKKVPSNLISKIGTGLYSISSTPDSATVLFYTMDLNDFLIAQVNTTLSTQSYQLGYTGKLLPEQIVFFVNGFYRNDWTKTDTNLFTFSNTITAGSTFEAYIFKPLLGRVQNMVLDESRRIMLNNVKRLKTIWS